MNAKRAEVLVVGAGPAGLAAAVTLKRLGVRDVLVVDREAAAGGIPRFCDHTGFGIFDLKRLYSGPGYARYYAALAERAGVEVWTETTVTGWQSGTGMHYTSPRGLGQIEARAVLLATGCRERPRAARLVPGSRPAGVFTTGSLQRFIYEQHLPVGRRAVIVGAELVSLSAVMSLGHAHVPVARMVTDLDRHQIPTLYLPPKWWLMDGLSRIPITSKARVSRVFGQKRVEGVEITHLDGAVETVACDTVVFSGDWIPEQDLARQGGLALHAGSRGPQVDGAFHTTQPGVFAAGNLLRGSETADVSAMEGQRAARPIERYLRDGQWPASRLSIEVAPPLEWIFPNAITIPSEPPPFGAFTFRVLAFRRNATVAVYQGQRRLHAQRYGELKPNWSVRLASGWLGSVDMQGEPLRAVLEAGG